MIVLAERSPIFVVDDSEADQMIIEIVLGQSHLTNPVQCFDSGAALFAHLDRVARKEVPFPCLLLLDINMPGTGGFDVLRELRSQPTFRTHPTVTMLSSSDAEADQREAKARGAQACLPKMSGIGAFVEMFDATFTNASDSMLLSDGHDSAGDRKSFACRPEGSSH